ncbi:MAG: translation initiation factor IF-2 N-terminal domain-containing protein, partial [Candidatus Sumerlaeia bacterium]|nr:translation initiation factor IF-2 N-terminal domain-containing protein [Candidatus Sumerlaeia bacterium]
MRVFELAKILNVSSQQIIKDLRRYRVQADSHMASVDDKVVRKLLALYEKRRKEEEIKAAELKQKQAEEELRRKEEEQRRKEEEEQRRRAEEEERKRREEEERRLREEAERKQREEEERKRREEAEARRAKELERSSSRLAEVLQKRQIESRPAKPATEEREKKSVAEKRKKPKRIRGKKEFDEVPEPIKLEEAKPFRRRKDSVKKRDRFKDVEDKFIDKTQRKQIRPTIFVAQPTAREQVIPPIPQRTPTLEKKIVEQPRVVELRGDITVGEFAEKIGVSVAEVIKKLMELGEVKTINQFLDPDVCELLASEFGINVKIVEESDESDIAEFLETDPETKLVPRPPVVTIMG